MGTCVNIELSVNIVYIAISTLISYRLIMNNLCGKWCSEHRHFGFFFSLCVFLYIFVRWCICDISPYKFIFYDYNIHLYKWSSSSIKFLLVTNYNILYLKYFYLQKLHTITLTMMSSSIKNHNENKHSTVKSKKHKWKKFTALNGY